MFSSYVRIYLRGLFATKLAVRTLESRQLSALELEVTFAVALQGESSRAFWAVKETGLSLRRIMTNGQATGTSQTRVWSQPQHT